MDWTVKSQKGVTLLLVKSLSCVKCLLTTSIWTCIKLEWCVHTCPVFDLWSREFCWSCTLLNFGTWIDMSFWRHNQTFNYSFVYDRDGYSKNSNKSKQKTKDQWNGGQVFRNEKPMELHGIGNLVDSWTLHLCKYCLFYLWISMLVDCRQMIVLWILEIFVWYISQYK